MLAMRPSFLVALTTLALSSCGGPGERDGFLTRDSAGIIIAENGLAGELPQCAMTAEPVVQIGTDEGEEAYELFRVFGATRLEDGRIVLVNDGTKELRFYDAEGQFLQRAGRGGEGPGEFRNAFYLWRLRGDTLWVGNYGPWRYHLFSPEGVYQRSVTPVPHYINSPELMGMLADGRAVLASRDGAFEIDTEYRVRYRTVVIHAPDGTVQDTLGVFPHGRWGRPSADGAMMMLYPLFESFTRTAVMGTHIVVAHTSTPELTVYDAGDGTPRVTRIIRWTTPDRRVGSADAAAERARLAAEYPDLNEQMRRMMVDPLISPDRPVAEVFPAFSSLLLGRDGRLWLQDYLRSRQPNTPNRWTVLGPDGRFTCRVTIPSGSTLLEADADYVLAHERDELGVERVVMYRLGGGE